MRLTPNETTRPVRTTDGEPASAPTRIPEAPAPAVTEPQPEGPRQPAPLDAHWLARQPPDLIRRTLDALPDHDLAALPYLFDFWAHPHQLPPSGDWRTWIILGGRGAGKTRAGSAI